MSKFLDFVVQMNQKNCLFIEWVLFINMAIAYDVGICAYMALVSCQGTALIFKMNWLEQIVCL